MYFPAGTTLTALLETGVVVGAHPRQHSDLLTTQAGDPPVATTGQTCLSRVDASAMSTQELTQAVAPAADNNDHPTANPTGPAQPASRTRNAIVPLPTTSSATTPPRR
jgi:hypothetical protein